MSEPRDVGSGRWLLLASAMVSFFAVAATFFVVPPLIAELRAQLALSNLQIGILMGAIAFPAILLSIPLGVAVDRWPPRAAGAVALVVMLLGAVMFALATGYAWLLAGRLLFGVGGLVLNLLLARLIAAAFAGRELSLAMGLFTGVYPASMIAVFTLHPALFDALGWRGELGVLAGLVLLALPLHLLAVPRRLPVTPQDLASGQDDSPIPSSLVTASLAWMLFFAALASVITFAPEWAAAGSAGLLTVSVMTWVSLVGTPAAGALIDRTGRPEAWCTVALVLFAATLAAMAANLVAPVLAMVLLGLVHATVPPAVYSLPSKLVAAHRVGFAFGFITALSNLGTVVGPAAAGALRDTTPSWATLWLALSAVALAGAAAAAMTTLRARSTI